ncbi:hypothetical protein ACFQ0B_35200 [Nonomuraea thailandensis]
MREVTVVGRDAGRAGELAARCRALGLTARALPAAPPPSAPPPAAPPRSDQPPSARPESGEVTERVTEAVAERVKEAVSEAVSEAVAEADLIACCTTARQPLFPGKLARDGVTVVAVGSHEPDARELDGDLIARATVVVEARAAALEEAGDVVVPIRQGTITSHHLAGNLADLIAGRVVAGPGPRVFKSTGMAWEDLVVAAAAYESRMRA